MIRIRKSEERGHTRLGWLDSRHTFSFGHYLDPAFMSFRTLRVLNDDRVAPGSGFPTHPHREMEILTWVIDGALAHKDSMGNASVLEAGELQRMTAGTGITHSEFNHSATEPAHFLQIWIVPERAGLEPGYEQRSAHGAFGLVASRDGRDDSLTVHQDVDVYAGAPAPEFVHELRPGRHAWLQIATGEATVNGDLLKEGDGAAVTDEAQLVIRTTSGARGLLFDLS
ncbi:MAG: pirin family protein [Planctomycetota bacterium]|jgi:redox-sensitive bicupin YhaK (pirin superfamily)